MSAKLPWLFSHSLPGWMLPLTWATQWHRLRWQRKFEIIGEALNQLSKLDVALASRIPDLPHIVAFRNQLIHGYATVSVSTVWNIAHSSLPPLLASVQNLLDELQ